MQSKNFVLLVLRVLMDTQHIEALLVDEGVLDPVVLTHFSFAMDLREGADYGCIYDPASARTVVMSARSVLAMVRP
jgi:hypothetical protein